MTLGTGPIRSFRILVLALLSALVIIGVALRSVLEQNKDLPDQQGSAPLWPLLVVLVLGVLVAGLIPAVGYRTPSLPPGQAAQAGRVIAVFQQLMFLRFALAESVVIVSIALTFVATPSSFNVYLLGAAIALVLILIHVYPSGRTVERVQSVLDRDGGHSDLADRLNGTGQ